jgi:Calx-beta domain-containing protein
VLTVELTAASGKTITVLFTTVPGTATETPPPADYQPLSGSLVYTPGQTSKTITVKVNGDTLSEPNEKFSVALTDPDNAGPEPDNRGEITITDDDATPIPALNSPSVLEGNSSTTDLVFEATLAAPHPALTFNFRTVNDSAAAPSDFAAQSGSKLFPANNTTTATKIPITIKVNGDALDELDETMKLELLNNNDAVVRTATGTIRNDDNNSKLSINDATSDEPGTMTFTVTLLPASGREVKVNWATADGTATAGVDYTGNSGQLTFAPGETSKAIDVSVLGDATNEENETLKVLLSNQTGIPAVNLIDGEGAGTIIDKNAPPTLSISDTLGREGQGATFTVTLAGTTLRTVTVNFNTADSTAKAGSDYAARTGTLSFAPGEKSKTVTITIIDDNEAEPVEEFFVVLGDAANATITKNRGEGSIEASDRPDTPTTATTPTTPPTAKPATVLVPRMILGPRTVSIGANGLAKMQVTCQKISPIACAGSVALERAAKPLLKLGQKTFTVKKGGKGYASIKLSLKSLRLLQRNGTMRVKVIVIVKTSAKSMKVSPGTITLKATKALIKAKLKAPPPTTKVVVDP